VPPRVFDPVDVPGGFAFGADLSFLKSAEDRGRKFRDQDGEKPGLQLFKDHGYNWIRLRIFVEPVKQNLPNDLAYTLAMAKDAKKLGYRFLLDFHYAQSWADPGKQPTPDAWLTVGHRARVEKVFAYTRDTIAAFRDAGVLPEMVQIGNEVRVGMLWPDGKLPENWDNFAEYLYAGLNGVDAGRGNGKRPRIMIQYDDGCDILGTRAFFDKVESYGIPYDLIGFSYYPWWHGSIAELRSNLRLAAERFKREVMVVEAAYHWRENGETRGKLKPFPETPEGQRQYLEEVTRAVMDVPNGKGTGVFWWEPATMQLGSRGMFDRDGAALPAIGVYEKFTRGKTASIQAFVSPDKQF
jgi:arabinogalactan endo-1,4-beta-galactosidase